METEKLLRLTYQTSTN